MSNYFQTFANGMTKRVISRGGVRVVFVSNRQVYDSFEVADGFGNERGMYPIRLSRFTKAVEEGRI